MKSLDFIDQCSDQIALDNGLTDDGRQRLRAARRSAALTICDNARDHDDARLLLEVTGLDAPPRRDLGLMAGSMPGDRAVSDRYRRGTRGKRGRG